MAEQQTSPDPEPTEASSTRRAFLGKIVIGGFMSGIVLMECLFAYFWIPTADEVAALAQARMAQEMKGVDPSVVEDEPAEEVVRVSEMDVGKYSVSAHQPASNTTLRVDFHLFATVTEEDEAEFAEVFARLEHRFRDQVLYEARNSELTDLTDPGLGLIKRRILEKSNRLFGKPILQTVIFSDFSFVEQ